MYKPAAMAPYPAPSFHYGPRPLGPGVAPPPPAAMPHHGGEPSRGPPGAPAPYGLITDLPLAVPTGDSQVGLLLPTRSQYQTSVSDLSTRGPVPGAPYQGPRTRDLCCVSVFQYPYFLEYTQP